MTKATRVLSTPRRFTPKIVAGTDFVVRTPDANALEEPATAQRKRRAMPATEIILDDQPMAGSATAGNGRLRKERHEAWRMVERATRYWRARIDFHDAVSSVQRRGMPEGRFHPDVDER